MRIQSNGAWLLALLVIIGLAWGIKGLGYAVLGLFLLPLLAVLAFLLFLGGLAWLLRLRMQRRLTVMRKAFADAEAQAARDAAAVRRHAEAIDVVAHIQTPAEDDAETHGPQARDAPADGAGPATDQSR